MLFKLVNIQSIENAEYVFPDTGIVQIKGGNSNGKSILFRAISAVVNLHMLENDSRNALIRDGYQEGSILMEYRSKALYVQLNRDRNKCAVAYMRQNGDTVTRTFRDGGIENLLREFGFACYSKNSICLQLYETFGPMPFVNTKLSENNEMVESVTEDVTAKRFLEAFMKHTHPKSVQLVKSYNKEIDRIKQVRGSLVLFDYKAYERHQAEMQSHLDIVRHMRLGKYTVVLPPPETKEIVDLSIVFNRMHVVPEYRKEFDGSILSLLDVQFSFEGLNNLIKDMCKLREGKCPTCGRPLVDISGCALGEVQCGH